MNMHLRKSFFVPICIAAAAAILLTGCGGAPVQSKMADSYAVYDTYSTMESAAAEPANGGISLARTTAAADSGSTAYPESDTALPQGRKWVITLNLNAETEDLDAALTAVSQQILACGGYVENQNINGSASASYRNASLTVRIPAAVVDQFSEQMAEYTNITYSSRDVTDITLSYTDTEGRISSLQTEESRLLELLEKAETVSDLLEIEGRLTEVRYQLETYTSRLRVYDNQVDYATVYLYISQVRKYTPAAERSFWQRITDGLADSITDLGNAVVDGIAWLIIDLPYLILFGLLLWGAFLLVRRSIRRRRQRKASQEKDQTP